MRNRSPLFLLLMTAALMVLLGIVEAVSAQDTAEIVKPAVTPPTTDVTVTVNTLANRHVISPDIYGANFPPTEAYITTGGVTRWAGILGHAHGDIYRDCAVISVEGRQLWD